MKNSDHLPNRMLPANLLEQTCEARVDYFRSFAVAHPRLVEAKDRLLAAIRESARNTLILVMGATGVGKTTLRLGIERILVKNALKELAADPGKAPAVAVEAVAPESGNFNWTFFFKLLLEAMEEPLAEKLRIRLSLCRRTSSSLPPACGRADRRGAAPGQGIFRTKTAGSIGCDQIDCEPNRHAARFVRNL